MVGSAGHEAHLFIDLPQGLGGGIGRLLRAGLVDALQIRLVGQDAGGLLPDGAQGLNDSLAHGGLELPIAAAGELKLDLLEAFSGDGGVDVHQVGHARLVDGVIAHTVFGVAVGDGPLELALNVLRLLHQEHAALGNGLGHFGLGIGQAHDAGAGLGDIGLRDLEHIAVDVVETLGHVPGQLAVLLLVLTHRDEIRLVEKNIRGHQGRVGEQAAVDVLLVLGGLVLELGHAAEFAEHGITVQHPAQLRVGGDVGLDEQSVLLRVQAAGDILGQLLQGAAAQVGGGLPDGDGVHIRHKVIAVEFVGPGAPILDGAQIVAQVQIAAGLDAAEDALAGGGVGLLHGKDLVSVVISDREGKKTPILTRIAQEWKKCKNPVEIPAECFIEIFLLL